MGNYTIDNLDLEILEILTQNSKVSYAEIAKKLIVSPGTIHVRLKKMESSGVVKGSVLKVDYRKLGYDLTAFIGIYLKSSSDYQHALRELKKISEVVEAHFTTGSYSIYIKLIARNTDHMHEILTQKIQKIKDIQRTETMLSLEESIHRNVRLI